jgi:hypothetical protein
MRRRVRRAAMSATMPTDRASKVSGMTISA